VNKYRKSTITIDGLEVERSNVVFVPKEKDGCFKTSDGTMYQRDKKGTIRKLPPITQ
jgi:hypothetical protein